MLNCQARNDGAVPRIRVARRIRFMIIEEQLADAAVRVSADRAGVAQAAAFELEG